MQILEELGTFVVSLALAVVLIGVAAALLYYFNPQQPVDHAKAAFYPLVRPINATHVWLGVKPSADKVEVVELKYQYRGRWADVPVARLTADRAVWLNTTDGRPAAVPCSANVTVATRHGTAARTISFTPVCLRRNSVDVADVTEVFRQLTDYASYVANYVLYKSIPAITAYLRFDSMYVGIQNIAPFAFQVMQNTNASDWRPWPPDYNTMNLLPLEFRDIWSGATEGLAIFLPIELGTVSSVMYRWLNVVVDWDNSTLRIWVNNALAYNGTPPQQAATFTSPQSFRVAFTPIDANTANVTLYYLQRLYGWFDPCSMWMPWPCYMIYKHEWVKAVSLTATRGRASSWSGWVKMINVPAPGYGESGFTRTIHVLPPAPYLGGNRSLFGVVTPFVVRSLTALRASNGTVFASYATDNGAVKMLTFTTPSGTFYLEEPLRNAVPEGFKQAVYIYAEGPYAVALGLEYKNSSEYRWVPFVHKSHNDIQCWISSIPGLIYGYYYVACRVYDGQGNAKLRVGFDLLIDGNGVVSVYRGDALQRRTRLGQLSAALAWTPDGRMYAASPVGMASDTTRVSAPFAYRWSLSGAYNYTLKLSITFGRNYVDTWVSEDSVEYTFYNVTYRGVMNLTYNGEPVAVDAFYGWYIKVTSRPLPPPPSSGSVIGGVGSFCIPNRIKIDEDQEHRELNKGSNGYSVQVINYATIRVTGCGHDYTYKEVTYVKTLTANGNIYQVTDSCRRVCGYGQARTCNGVVYCGSCTCG
jgi:hypothetical protein